MRSLWGIRNLNWTNSYWDNDQKLKSFPLNNCFLKKNALHLLLDILEDAPSYGWLFRNLHSRCPSLVLKSPSFIDWNYPLSVKKKVVVNWSHVLLKSHGCFKRWHITYKTTVKAGWNACEPSPWTWVVTWWTHDNMLAGQAAWHWLLPNISDICEHTSCQSCSPILVIRIYSFSEPEIETKSKKPGFSLKNLSIVERILNNILRRKL